RAHAFGAGPCAWVLFGPRRLGPPLLPYTTLFRSDRVAAGGLGRRRELGGARRPLRAALRVATPDPPLRDRLPAAVPASPPGGDDLRGPAAAGGARAARLSGHRPPHEPTAPRERGARAAVDQHPR